LPCLRTHIKLVIWYWLEQYYNWPLFLMGNAAKARPTTPIYFLFSLGEMPMIRLATLTAASWQCQRCVATPTTLRTTRGVAIHAGWGGTWLIRQMMPASWLPTRRQEADTHGNLLRRETCRRGREHAKTSREPRDAMIRLPTAPTPLYTQPHGLTLTTSYLSALQLPTSHSYRCHFVDGNDAPNIASPRKGERPTKRGGKRKSPSQGLSGVFSHLSQPPLPPACRPM